MKAMILAAGVGNRLRPLTDELPKPMVPVANAPVLAHVITALRRHGFDDLAINLNYLPEQITGHFGDGGDHGVRIRYSHEPEALGTAGGVKRLGSFWDDTFLVVGGDDLTDMGLSDMLAFHRSHGGLATLALYPVADPSQFGVVVLDGGGRITAFQEKPKREEAKSNLCNMQVYLFEPEILDLIPDEGFFDFGSQLFPVLAAQGAPIYGYRADGYWRDIGNPRDYLAANLDFLCERTDLCKTVPQDRSGVDPAATLVEPLHIAAGAIVEAGATVGPYCVIGERCHVHTGATLRETVLWPGVHIGQDKAVASAIVTPRGTVEVPPEGSGPCAPSGKA